MGPLGVAPPRRRYPLLGAAAGGDEIAHALTALAADLLVELAAPFRLHCQPALPAADEAALAARLAYRHAAELGLTRRAPSRQSPGRHLQFRCRATARLPAGPLGLLVGHLVSFASKPPKCPRTLNLWTAAGTASRRPRIRRKQCREGAPVRHRTVNERKLGRPAARCKRATFWNCLGKVSGPSGQLGDGRGDGGLELSETIVGADLAGARPAGCLTKVEGVGRAVPFRGDSSDLDGRACPVQGVGDGVQEARPVLGEHVEDRALRA